MKIIVSILGTTNLLSKYFYKKKNRNVLFQYVCLECYFNDIVEKVIEQDVYINFTFYVVFSNLLNAFRSTILNYRVRTLLIDINFVEIVFN